jgi:Fic family protein
MYTPPFEITPKIINLISEISERIGEINIKKDLKLRKVSKIKTLTGTLKIEGIEADEKKVTAILEGKRVLATQREIAEIKGAVRLYENIDKFDYKNEKDLLKAHKILMRDILTNAGEYRKTNVGVGNQKEITHIAPPASNVPELMKDLFTWLNTTDLHPLIVSSIFHYEFEFIHPFIDGNGRIGRFWQTLILYSWKQVFEYLPVESLIYENQDEGTFNLAILIVCLSGLVPLQALATQFTLFTSLINILFFVYQITFAGKYEEFKLSNIRS